MPKYSDLQKFSNSGGFHERVRHFLEVRTEENEDYFETAEDLYEAFVKFYGDNVGIPNGTFGRGVAKKRGIGSRVMRVDGKMVRIHDGIRLV